MHAALLTLLVVVGQNQADLAPVAEHSITVAGNASYVPCEACSTGRCRVHRRHPMYEYVRDQWGPMPQTCYAPRYGCYPGNDRHMHRYPAFHGTYYRTPYNYRNVFDYPWHAAPHEPVGYFTRVTEVPMGTETEYGAPTAAPFPGQPQVAPPMPPTPAPAVGIDPS